MLFSSNLLKSLFDNISLSILLSLSVLSGVLFFKPLDIILSNPTDFLTSPEEYVFYYLSGISAYLLSLFIITLLVLFIEKLKPWFVAILFSLSLLFFIQSNILNWNYGLLDGRSIFWNGFWYRELIDLAIWGGVFYFAFTKRLALLKQVKLYALAIILVQAIPVSLEFFNYLSEKKESTHPVASEKLNDLEKKYFIDQDKKFVFSKNRNIIILVLDAISNSTLEKILLENPEFKKEFDGFIRFDNVLGAGGYTRFSVPSFFSGQPYLNHIPVKEYLYNAYRKDGSILKELRKNGWNTGFYKNVILRRENISPEILTEIKYDYYGNKIAKYPDPDLKRLSLYQSSPQILKRWFYNLFELRFIWQGKNQDVLLQSEISNSKSKLLPFPSNSVDLKFINKMMYTASATYEQPAFKYFHLVGAHAPYTLDKKFRITNATKEDAIYVSLKIAVRFIDILKEIGIYDSSQIYLMADHGSYPTSSITKKVEQYIKSHYPDSASPMLMFKDYSSRGTLEKSSIPLSYFDFPSIVISLSDKIPNVSPLEIVKTFARKIRKFYSFSNTIGDYYPKIIEAQVEGDIKDPRSWSLTGKEFLPATVKPQRAFNCENDILSLTKRDEYLRYIPDNLLDGSGLTRGGNVNMTLPLDSNCLGDDILIKLRLAAVLGKDKRTGDVINSRIFQIRLYDKYESTIVKLDTEEFTDFTVLIPKEYIEGNSLNLTLRLKNYSRSLDFFNRQGKRIVAAALKLDSLAFSSQKNDVEHIELEPID